MEAALVLVSRAYGEPGSRIRDCVGRELDGSRVVAAEVGGILAGGHERYRQPAVAVLALRGFEVRVAAHDGPLGEEPFGDLARDLGLDRDRDGAGDLVLGFFDASGGDPGALVRGIDEALDHRVAFVGAAAQGGRGEPAMLWSSEGAAQECGLVAMRIALPTQLGMTHGCRRQQDLGVVTRSVGNWVHAVEGEPALDVFRRAVGPALAADLMRARRSVLAEVVPEAIWSRGSAGDCRRDSHLRNIVGIDASTGAIGLPGPVGRGDRIGFAVRDAIEARQDLEAMLGDVVPNRASAAPFAIYLSCRGRGEALFGIAGLELGYVERALAGVPVLGIAAPLQLVRSAGSAPPASLLSHAGVLALPEPAAPENRE